MQWRTLITNNVISKKLSWCWQTRATRLEVSQGHQRWYHKPHIRYGFPSVCYSNFVPKGLRQTAFEIFDFKMSWYWNPGQRSLKVIENDTDRSATYEFLLILHINHMPSYLSRDKRKFQSKIANFAHPVLLTPSPLKGFPL